MKKLLLLGALLGVTCLGAPAHAQQDPVNCGALSGSPLMCIKNRSPYTVVGVQANVNPGYGQQWLQIPGGPIPPGGTSIVNFGNWNGKCRMYVNIRTDAGLTHSYPNVDVCGSTSFIVTS